MEETKSVSLEMQMSPGLTTEARLPKQAQAAYCKTGRGLDTMARGALFSSMFLRRALFGPSS